MITLPAAGDGGERTVTRKVAINFEEVASAMEDRRGYNEYFLDLQSGELEVIPTELLGWESYDGEKVADLPDWEQDLIPIVREIEEGTDRYEAVPTVPSYEVYNLMVEFAETVSDQGLRRLLLVALDGIGAFRRFKDVLGDYPEERERWFAMKDAVMNERVREWLGELGIEAVERRADSEP